MLIFLFNQNAQKSQKFSKTIIFVICPSHSFSKTGILIKMLLLYSEMGEIVGIEEQAG